MCKCKIGYYGRLCDEIERYPTCVNGYAEKPYECICLPGWGGSNCNLGEHFRRFLLAKITRFLLLDLNYCTNHRPCQNDGICQNSGAGHYTCICAPGFSGTNCEREIKQCTDERNPCLHGGTCVVSDFRLCLGMQFLTVSKRKRHFERTVSHCRGLNSHLQATSNEPHRNFTCACPNGVSGDYCQIVDGLTCADEPCRNAGTCLSADGELTSLI